MAICCIARRNDIVDCNRSFECQRSIGVLLKMNNFSLLGMHRTRTFEFDEFEFGLESSCSGSSSIIFSQLIKETRSKSKQGFSRLIMVNMGVPNLKDTP